MGGDLAKVTQQVGGGAGGSQIISFQPFSHSPVPAHSLGCALSVMAFSHQILNSKGDRPRNTGPDT